MALQDYIGVMALGLNDQQHGDALKLGSADPHMLAAYCFDLTRKQHYLYMALRLSEDQTFTYNGETIASAGALARAICQDTQFVEDAAERVRQTVGALWNRARDWEARAYALQEIIIRQWRAIEPDYQRLLEDDRLNLPSLKLRYTGVPGHTPTRAPSPAIWPDPRTAR